MLVRTSGTEPLVRVMVEAETQDVADAEVIANSGKPSPKTFIMALFLS